MSLSRQALWPMCPESQPRILAGTDAIASQLPRTRRPCGLAWSNDAVDGVTVNESMPPEDRGRDGIRGPDAVRGLRVELADICDLIPLTAEEDFHFTSRTKMTGNALLVESLVSDLEYDRTPAHIARGGLDHYQIALCVEGELWFSSGRREVTARPGD